MTQQKKTAPQKAEGPSETKSSSIDDVLNALNNLTEEDRIRMREAGFVTPAVKGVKEFDHPKLGYRCDYCGEMGLYFTGAEFLQPDGSYGDLPSTQTAMANLPWTQRVPVEQQNRVSPNCQSCGTQLKLGVNRTPRPQNVKNIGEYEAARKEAMSPEVVKRLKSLGHGGNYDGGTPSRDYNAPDRRASDLMSPAAKEDITNLAEQNDLLGKLADGSLKAPLAPR